jgi:thymidylate synthase
VYWISDDLAECYRDILVRIRDNGDKVAPRGLPTRELLSFTLQLRDPTRALVRGTNRKIHVGLASAEALQLVGGFSDPGAMMKVSPHFEQFMDGGVFHAPYGPRIASQMQPAIDWLMSDQDTRKAWIQVWDPVQDLLTHDTRDHPCTTAIQFMIRRDKLNAHVFMRANDAWRGFPYDVFQFCQLQLAVAATIGIEPGSYYHHATSLHLYEENVETVDVLKPSNQDPIPGLGFAEQIYGVWGFAQERARQLFYSQSIEVPDTYLHTSGELTMWNALRKCGISGSW